MMILNNPFIADADLSNHIDLREGATLGLALTLNNIANGVGAGMIGLNIMLLTLLVFIVSIVTIWVGIKIGAYYGHRIFGRLTGFAAGILLVVIGVYEIIF
jgi:putative sporulation protein YtaF